MAATRRIPTETVVVDDALPGAAVERIIEAAGVARLRHPLGPTWAGTWPFSRRSARSSYLPAPVRDGLARDPR